MGQAPPCLRGGDISSPALVQAKVRRESGWEAVTTFCKTVLLGKEEVELIATGTPWSSGDGIQFLVTVVAGLLATSSGQLAAR